METHYRVEKIRILGMWLQENGQHERAIRKLEGSAQQTTGLIKRIANRQTDMKQTNLLKLVQAFVVSRLDPVATPN